MAIDGNLLEISYERIISSEEITLTIDNCSLYGYVSKTEEIDGVSYTVFYKEDDPNQDVIGYEIVNGVAITKILNNVYKEYTHIAPSRSNFKVQFVDVDKEGSGRN